eukprot:comp19805_c0_seq1/m.38289 comp19805_c0_seq1/g.38289  ORF comp19805_c0_seq1/g.38289 comp19805_c0_seq1/m.38289 type:complete len:383 (-) comp19805_c0_seq1:67-1215(-)
MSMSLPYLPSRYSLISLPPDQFPRRGNITNIINGIIFGHALGDAIGLNTEFMDRAMCLNIYGSDRVTMNFAEKHKDQHRSRWLTGEWTDDTDQMICIMQSITHSGGEVNIRDIAYRILHWARNGMPELHKLGNGIGSTVHAVLMDPQFTSDPHSVAKRIWDKSGGYLAANGAVMRTSVLGIVDFYDLNRVCTNATNVCKITHYDPRCIASCLVVVTIIAVILQGQLDPNIPERLEEIILIAQKQANSHIQTTLQLSNFDSAELARYCSPVDSFADLQLDEKSSIGYTYKCLAAGLHALRSKDPFEKTITDLVMQGGDADTNGAVAGALLGCKLGYSNLPINWLNGLRHGQFLQKYVDQLIFLMFEGRIEQDDDEKEENTRLY